MIKVKEIKNFSYSVYNRVLMLKFVEVVLKEFFKLFLFSGDRQKRRFFMERLGFLPAVIPIKGKDAWIWVHANAIGEVNASQELIRIIKNKYPAARILLTTANFSADDRARQMQVADLVAFFPHDLDFIIKKFFKFFKPAGAIIVEIDIWPNFVKVCKNNRIPVFLVSGICTNNSTRSIGIRYLYNYRFKLSEDVFRNMDYFCMQTQEDVSELSGKISGQNRISRCGNLKFSEANNSFTKQQVNSDYQKIFRIGKADPVFVAGNVHLSEAETILSAFKKVKEDVPQTVMILAPRLLEETSSMESLLKNSGLRYTKRTSLDNNGSRFKEDVIILDTMGELSDIYSLARVAFVGGSLIHLGDVFGGHNILEPARFGVPVIFGSHMHNFRALADLFLRNQIAVEVDDVNGLADNIKESLVNDKKRESVKLRTREIFEQNADVAEKTFDRLKPFLDTSMHQLENSERCEVCAGRDFKFIIRQDKYKILRCRRCGLVFSYPLPSDEELDAFYQNFSFNEFEGRFAGENQKIGEYVTRKQINLLGRLGQDINRGRFLDIGCGNGYYLFGAKACGFETFGVEKDKTAAEYARSHYGARVFSCGLKECSFPDKYFDIVKMRQFIEHLPNPAEYLREVNRILKTAGMLILETVNTRSLETITRLYFLDAFKKIKSYMPELSVSKKLLLSIRREWAFTDPPRHLYGFSRNNLEAILINNGFSPLRSLTAVMGDKVHYPVSKGHLSFLRQNEKDALGRLYKKSKIMYVFYGLMFKPAMAILKLYIKLFGLGSHLIIYAKKGSDGVNI